MGDYIFYYDESEHSRKLTEKTISVSNFCDSFITACVGYKLEYENKFNAKYQKFEQKFVSAQIGSEIKSSLITGWLSKGFASVNKNKLPFMADFFMLFDENIYFCFSIINKIEYIVNQLLCYYENNLFFDADNMRYSVTKLLILYKPRKVISAIYNNNKNVFIDELLVFAKHRIKENNKNVKNHLKDLENNILKELIAILSDYNKDIIFDWNYKTSFEGFEKYIKEKSIKNYTLFLDKEGEDSEDSRTYISAKSISLNAVEVDSKEYCGIRMADIFAGILSKFLKAIDNELRYSDEVDYTNKKLLPEDWFILEKQQFLLYKQYKNIICDMNNAFYKSYTSYYSDSMISLIVLLNYIDGFKDYESFQAVMACDHKIEYHKLQIKTLMSYFDNKRNKLPIEPVSIEETTPNNGEYYIDQRGTKIFLDYTKYSLLPIEKQGTIYEVLNVGFFGKFECGYITIKNLDESSEIYTLPKELFDWVLICLACANAGEKIFPSKVKFESIEGQFYVELL